MFRGQDRDQGVADERHAGALAHRKWANELDKLAMQYQNGAAPAETPDGVYVHGELVYWHVHVLVEARKKRVNVCVHGCE